MPRVVLLCAGCLFVLFPTMVVGQTVAEGLSDQPAAPLPPPTPSTPTPADELPAIGEPVLDEVTEKDQPKAEPPRFGPLDDFWGYRYAETSTGWIIGDGDQFGMFSLETNHYQPRGASGLLRLGTKIHFVAGPESTDMPPHLFDFSAGLQRRARHGIFGYDVAAAVMASSDFEGSSRDGIRFPAHAVGFLKVDPNWDLVFGADYLDRGDIQWLPVGGVIVLPHPDVRLELVFPRPRITFQLTDRQRLAIGGELGGGSWAIERTTFVDDLATYRDLRLSISLERAEEDGEISVFEVAYLFDRKLEYASGAGDYYPRDSVMIRVTHTY